MKSSGRALGEAIRFLRGRRSQAQVSELAGLDPAVWSLYERGLRVPRETNLRLVLEGLGCSRLDLEEVAWRLRRRELLPDSERADKADRQELEVGPAGGAKERRLGEAVDLARRLLRALEALQPIRGRGED